MVDGDQWHGALLTSQLLRRGVRARTARTLADAQHRVAAERPDVVLTEIALPDGTGIDLLEFARAQQARTGRRCLVVAVTQLAQGDAARRARRAGFDAFFAKPASIDDVCSALDALLGHKPCATDSPRRRRVLRRRGA